MLKELLQHPIGKLALNAALTGQRPTTKEWEDTGALKRFDFDNYKLRDPFTKFFSWAIPSAEAIAAIIELGPCLEVMAGQGYWANLINAAGGKIIATDDGSWKYDGNWFQVNTLQAFDAVKICDYESVLICWPHFNSKDDTPVLKHMKPCSHLIFVGESAGGCTGSEDFHDTMCKDFEEIRTITLPQWDGIHDELVILKKKDK